IDGDPGPAVDDGVRDLPLIEGAHDLGRIVLAKIAEQQLLARRQGPPQCASRSQRQDRGTERQADAPASFQGGEKILQSCILASSWYPAASRLRTSTTSIRSSRARSIEIITSCNG